MGSCSTYIDLEIPTESRENLIHYYEFVDAWTDLLGLGNKKIEAKFRYAIGQITSISDTFEEFKTESVGHQTDLVNIQIHIYDGVNSLYYINISKRHPSLTKNVYISCDSRQLLSRLLDCLAQVKEKYFSQEATRQITEQHIHGDQINITNSLITCGNIGGKSNTININDTKKEKAAWKIIIETIIANIASNAIWWVLCAIGVAVLAYGGVKNL